MGGRGSSYNAKTTNAARAVSANSESVLDRVMREMRASNSQAEGGLPDFTSGFIGEYVPDWILKKKFDIDVVRYQWEDNGGEDFVKRETNKAILVVRPTNYGDMSVWVPKSQLKGSLSEGKMRKLVNHRMTQAYNKYLVNTAKQHHIDLGDLTKVIGSDLDTATIGIYKKLSGSGVKFMDPKHFSDASYDDIFR